MCTFDHRPNRPGIRSALGKAAVVLLLAGLAPISHAQGQKGWQLERGVEPPTYVFTSPATTDIGIDTLVLTCNAVGPSTILQLELYPVGPLPLIPPGATVDELREYPHLQLSIDGRTYPVSMYAADDHLLVADSEVGPVPAVSRQLVDAMARGQTLRLRFQLLNKPSPNGSGYDGEATFELQAGGGGMAIGAMRVCVFQDGVRLSRRVD